MQEQTTFAPFWTRVPTGQLCARSSTARHLLAMPSALLLREGEQVPRLVEALEAVLTAVAEVGLSAEQEVAHG